MLIWVTKKWPRVRWNLTKAKLLGSPKAYVLDKVTASKFTILKD